MKRTNVAAVPMDQPGSQIVDVIATQVIDQALSSMSGVGVATLVHCIAISAVMNAWQVARECPEWTMALLDAIEHETGFAQSGQVARTRQAIRELVARHPLRSGAEGEGGR